MTIKNGDSPSMPLMLTSEMVALIKSNPEQAGVASGTSKRELFAAMAMQGILAADANNDVSYAECAEWAVKQADALLEALESTK